MKPKLPPDVAAAVLRRYGTHHGKLTVAVASELLGTYLRSRGERDRFGNYLESDGTRWHFATQVVQHQERRNGAWANITSQPLLEAGLALIAEAARVADDEGAAERVAAEAGGREKAKGKRADGARRDEIVREASIAAMKAFGHAHPNALLRASKIGSPLKPDELKRHTDKLMALRDEFVLSITDGAPVPPDGDYASADRPPVAALVRGVRYAWEETVGGEVFTVRIEHVSEGLANVEIGKPAGAITINAATLSPRTTPGARAGGAYLSGTVSVSPKGGPQASLVMMTSQSPTGGLRVGSIWCRMMAGYGVKQWRGVALNAKALRFVELLRARGAVEVVSRDASGVVMRCAGAK